MHSKAGTYLTALLKKHQQRIIEYLPGISPHAKKKDIYKVRVSIKKIDTVYRLLDFAFPSEFSRKKEYEKIKKLFKRLGKYRELQLCNEYVKSLYLPYNSVTLYRQFYTSEKHKALKHLKKEIVNFDKNTLKDSVALAEKTYSIWKDADAIRKIKEYIGLQVTEMKKALADFGKRENIHTIRKQMKAIKYELILFGEIRPSGKIKQRIAYLEDTETLIGNWHDRINQIDFLTKLKIKKLKNMPVEKESFSATIRRLANDNKITLTELKPRINDIIVTLATL